MVNKKHRASYSSRNYSENSNYTNSGKSVSNRKTSSRKKAPAHSYERSAYGSSKSTRRSSSNQQEGESKRNNTSSRKNDRRYSQRQSKSSSSIPYSRNKKEYLEQAKQQKKKAKRKKIILSVIIVFAVLVLGGGAFAWAYMNSLEGNLKKGVDQNLLNSLAMTSSSTDPFYMLLIGIDKSEDRAESEEFGGSFRTDSMILARVDPSEKKVTLVSIPRDTKVELPEHGTQKINAAYAFDGPSGAIDAVSELAGVEINHYAEIDFDGFEAVVDALGGIDVDVAMEINDDMAGGHVDAGYQTLNGEQALILCRSRHAYDDLTDGDSMRAANQRLVLSAIMSKIASSDIATMSSSISTLSEYVTTDFSVSDVLALAQTMIGIDVENNVYTASCPTTSVYEDDIWWEEVNTQEWKEMMKRVDQGLSPTEDDEVDEASGVVTAHVGDGGSSTSSDTTSLVSLENVEISVRNGAGIAGCASEAASKLTSEGAIVNTGNADDYNYKETMVIYNNVSDESTAEDIADVLGVGNVKKNNGVYSFSGDYLVVIGADWSD